MHKILCVSTLLNGKFCDYWRISKEKWINKPLILRFLFTEYAHLKID
jgi:hypothetical protein